MLMVFLTRFVIYFPAPTKEIDVALQVQQALAKEKRQNEKFAFYIEDGYQWLNKNNFTNALHQFYLAVEQRPNSYDAQKGLTLALLKQCSVEHVGCEKAELQYLNLKKKIAEKSNISNEVSNYLIALGDTLMAKKFSDLSGGKN